MGIRILIPCKPLKSGKTRLSGVLAEPDRAALCARLLAQTIALAASMAPTTVVTSDPAAADIARRNQALVFAEPPRADLNMALAAAHQALMPHDAVLVLPIDLPLLTSATLRRVCADENIIAIVPDRLEAGTNLMLLPRQIDRSFRFCYGIDSFRRHCAEAARLGLPYRICHFPDAAFDVDTPEDLAEMVPVHSRAEMTQ
jgi:2-phospho-L-lactate/phosphoenolpyruvate guanylyltransferase